LGLGLNCLYTPSCHGALKPAHCYGALTPAHCHGALTPEHCHGALTPAHCNFLPYQLSTDKLRDAKNKVPLLVFLRPK
jgi:hypothetical protein